MRYKDNYWLNADSRTFLKRDYLEEGIEPEQRIRQIAETAERYLRIDGYADRFETYMCRGWISLASPVWSNFGNHRGLPCSCNGSYVPDTIEGILDKVSEVAMMTKVGAGTSAYFGKLRARGTPISVGGASMGPVHFMRLFDSVTDVISQSSVRRGSFAAYLDIEHPDILEFLQIRGEGNEIQHISIGVSVGDAWMRSMIDGDVEKRRIWGQVIKKRFESGYPYLFFADTVNRLAPQVYRDKGLTIYASNLCSEIALSSSVDSSFVCVLSSLNLLHYDEWRESDLVETMIYFLDAICEEYIQKSEGNKHLAAANRFCREQRALGLGVLGWHSYLQSHLIPFESMDAKLRNAEIFRHIRLKADQATVEMAGRYGEPELLRGYGRRNVTTLAIAPTTSSSFILGQVSPSIEPLNSNYFVKNLAKGKFTYKNPYLRDVLKRHDQNTEDVWRSVLIKGGSVQHLDFLSQEEKDVFKTFGEISQKEILIQASQRQKYVDQSQSLNLTLPLSATPKEVNALLIAAWELGLKTLYYNRSANPAQELARDILSCKSCEA